MAQVISITEMMDLGVNCRSVGRTVGRPFGQSASRLCERAPVASGPGTSIAGPAIETNHCGAGWDAAVLIRRLSISEGEQQNVTNPLFLLTLLPKYMLNTKQDEV